MLIHRKNIIIYCLLDIAYVILSVNVIVLYYIPEAVDWYGYIPFIIIFALGGYGLFIYRSQSNAVLPISKQQYQWTRILTFAFLTIYVAEMIIIPDPSTYQATLSILIGSILGVIAVISLVMHVYMLTRGLKK